MLKTLRRFVRNTRSRRIVRARLARLKEAADELCPLCDTNGDLDGPVSFLPPYRPDGRKEAERPDPMNPISEPFTPFPPITDEEIDEALAPLDDHEG